MARGEVIDYPLIHGDGSFSVPVVGESHHQEALERLCGGRTSESADQRCDAVLILEDSNQYDHRAVRVEVGGHQVGYLTRDFAPTFRAALEVTFPGAMAARCQARIRGGWDRGHGDQGHFGVVLDISWPSASDQISAPRSLRRALWRLFAR
jgi:hypothetical protein